MMVWFHAGCFISGLFLEGAEWDTENGCLVKSRPKVLVVQLPILKVIPTESRHLSLQVCSYSLFFLFVFFLKYRFIKPVFYAAEYAANSGVHHLTEEECNGCGVGV